MPFSPAYAFLLSFEAADVSARSSLHDNHISYKIEGSYKQTRNRIRLPLFRGPHTLVAERPMSEDAVQTLMSPRAADQLPRTIYPFSSYASVRSIWEVRYGARCGLMCRSRSCLPCTSVVFLPDWMLLRDYSFEKRLTPLPITSICPSYGLDHWRHRLPWYPHGSNAPSCLPQNQTSCVGSGLHLHMHSSWESAAHKRKSVEPHRTDACRSVNPTHAHIVRALTYTPPTISSLIVGLDSARLK